MAHVCVYIRMHVHHTILNYLVLCGGSLLGTVRHLMLYVCRSAENAFLGSTESDGKLHQ